MLILNIKKKKKNLKINIFFFFFFFLKKTYTYIKKKFIIKNFLGINIVKIVNRINQYC